MTHSNVAWKAKKKARGSQDPRKYLQISCFSDIMHLWKSFT